MQLTMYILHGQLQHEKLKAIRKHPQTIIGSNASQTMMDCPTVRLLKVLLGHRVIQPIHWISASSSDSPSRITSGCLRLISSTGLSSGTGCPAASIILRICGLNACSAYTRQAGESVKRRVSRTLSTRLF